MAGRCRPPFRGPQPRFCIISFTSDWLFPTSESRDVVHALNAVAANVSFVEIETDKGHDAFLLHEPELFATLRGFLTGCAEHRGLPRVLRRMSGAERTPRCGLSGRASRRQRRARIAPPLGELRRDLRLIAEMIEPGSRVLDIGCGDGALLAYLAREKGVDARGIELSQSGVNACVRHGLSVIQGDADRDLARLSRSAPSMSSC